MSSTEADDLGSAEDQAYFRALEQAFLELRGRATLLSPEDWQVAAGWRRAGVPIDLVVSVMSNLFARLRERKSKRGISSLRYFRAAVDAAWDERLALEAGGFRAPPPPVPLEARLQRLAAVLPDSVPGVAALRASILEARGDVGEIESRLAALDLEILASLAANLAHGDRVKIDERVRRALAQVPPPQRESAGDELRQRLERQALRALFGLPVLSLFAPETETPAS